MKRLRTLTLPAAAAAALLLGAAAAAPASAAPAAPASATSATTASAATGFTITPSPIYRSYLQAYCPPGSPEKAVVASQQINWMWAPLSLDTIEGKPLAKVFVPYSISGDQGFRDRHNLVQTTYTAPGPQPKNAVTCDFEEWTADGQVLHFAVTGTFVSIPKWLDALQPPIQPPKRP